MYRIAVTDHDDTFAWHDLYDDLELAETDLPAAEAEYPEAGVTIERLDDDGWVDIDGVRKPRRSIFRRGS